MRLIGNLKLERFDKDYRLLERRVQPMRSWTKGLIDLLYTECSQAVSGTPANSVDVHRVTRAIDVSPCPGAGAQFWHARNTMLTLASPPGGSLTMLSTFMDNSQNMSYNYVNTLLGEQLGIQIGIDNTAVTPTDYKMSQRIGHGRRAADGAPVVLMSCTASEDADEEINGAAWVAIGIVPKVSCRCTKVTLKLWKNGACGDVTVSIRGCNSYSTGPIPDASSLDIGGTTATIAEAAMGASPGALLDATFGTPIDLYAGHYYWIVIRALTAAGANHAHLRIDTAGTLFMNGIPTGGSVTIFSSHGTSANSGVLWADGSAKQGMFELYGQSVGEMEYGGTEVTNLAFADPNGSFDIRRFFYNHSGGEIDVVEAGLQAPAFKNALTSAAGCICNAPFLIARDVFAAVHVANTEILLVTYTPAIVV